MQLPDKFFRELDEKEQEEFRQWARDNHDPNKEPDKYWHPVVIEEWNKLTAKHKEALEGAIEAEEHFSLDELEEHARKTNG